MKTSTIIILGVGIAAAIYLLTQNPANAIIPGANDNSGTGAGGTGTGTQSLVGQMRTTGTTVPGTGTIFGTGAGTTRAYRSLGRVRRRF